MPKIYPTILVKCSECPETTTIPLDFNPVTFTQADPVIIPEDFENWRIRDGLDGRDLCPKCDALMEEN